MRPIRIYPRDNSFLIQYYLPGRDAPVQKRTGVPLDVDVDKLKAKWAARGKAWSVKADPDWWQASEYAKVLKAMMKKEQDRRIAIAFGYLDMEPEKPRLPSLRELLDALNQEANTKRRYNKGELADQTVRRRIGSVKQILNFDPKATIESINDMEWAESYSEYLKTFKALRTGKPLTQNTQKTYISDLKLLVSYAAKKDIIEKDRLRDIIVGRPTSNVRHTDLDHEIAGFRHLAEVDRHVLEQVLHIRLGGFRVSDSNVFQLDSIDFKHETFYPYNVKGRRDEGFPISTNFNILFHHLTGMQGEYAYFYRQYAALYQKLHDAMVDAPKLYVPMHQYKRNYSRELEELQEDMPEHVFKMLLHHQGGLTVKYTGRNLALMARWLNRAQEKLTVALREIFA